MAEKDDKCFLGEKTAAEKSVKPGYYHAKANQWWKLRKKHGRNPIFATPEDFLKACLDYVAWNEKNPLKEEKLIVVDKKVVRRQANKMCAMTKQGLCIHIGIDIHTFNAYKKRSDDFSAVCLYIEDIIYKQKFQGAAAGLLNHAIIARDLGLADKSEVTGNNGGPIVTQSTVLKADMDQSEAQKLYKQLMNDE